LVKSFGFGQVGGELLVIHPDYILGALSRDEYQVYSQRRQAREAKTYRYLYDSMIGVSAFVQVKNSPPYSDELESTVYLNPQARASYDSNKNTWIFQKPVLEAPPNPESLQMLLQNMADKSSTESTRGIGVDVQVIADIDPTNTFFVERNYTEAEQKYCLEQADVAASLAGRWAAKEAVLKALCNALGTTRPSWLKGAGSPLDLVEILPTDVDNRAPKVILHGAVLNGSDGLKVRVSISHSGAYAVAMAIIQ